MKPAIYLNVSEIASFINQNKWDFITPFERLWKKYDLKYNNVINVQKEEIEAEKIKLDVLKNDKEILQSDFNASKIGKEEFNKEMEILDQGIINSKLSDKIEKMNDITLNQTEKISLLLGKEVIVDIKNKNIDTDTKKNETIEVIKNAKISETKKQDMIKTTESLINKTHGNINEDSAIGLFEKKYGVKLDTAQTYIKKELNVDNSEYKWIIGGKIDGLHSDYIVEAKSRVRCFFKDVRNYENTQIQLYMWIKDYKSSKLVEKFNNKIKVTNINIDNSYLEEIQYKLKIFISNFEDFLNYTQEEKLDYLNKNEEDKKEFLRELYLDKM